MHGEAAAEQDLRNVPPNAGGVVDDHYCSSHAS